MTIHKHPCPTAGYLLSEGGTEEAIPKGSWPADSMMTNTAEHKFGYRFFLWKLFLEEMCVIQLFIVKPKSQVLQLLHLLEGVLGIFTASCTLLIFTENSVVLEVE